MTRDPPAHRGRYFYSPPERAPPPVVLKVLTAETQTRSDCLFLPSVSPSASRPEPLIGFLSRWAEIRGGCTPPSHLAFNLHGAIVAATGWELDSHSLSLSLSFTPSLSLSLFHFHASRSVKETADFLPAVQPACAFRLYRVVSWSVGEQIESRLDAN